MIKHEFIALKRDQIPYEITFELTRHHECVVLPDEIILHNMNDFSLGFTSHWNTQDNKNEGLNYYGITIINNEELDQFIEALKKHKRWKSVKELIRFCESAKANSLDVIHFGI